MQVVFDQKMKAIFWHRIKQNTTKQNTTIEEKWERYLEKEHIMWVNIIQWVLRVAWPNEQT